MLQTVRSYITPHWTHKYNYCKTDHRHNHVVCWDTEELTIKVYCEFLDKYYTPIPYLLRHIHYESCDVCKTTTEYECEDSNCRKPRIIAGNIHSHAYHSGQNV